MPEVDIERNRCCCGLFKVEWGTYVVAVLSTMVYFGLLMINFMQRVDEEMITEVDMPKTNERKVKEISTKSIGMMVAVVGVCLLIVIAQRIKRPMLYVPFMALNGGAILIAIVYIFMLGAIWLDAGTSAAMGQAIRSILKMDDVGVDELVEMAPFMIILFSAFVFIALWFEYIVCRAYEVTQLKRGESGGFCNNICCACCKACTG